MLNTIYHLWDKPLQPLGFLKNKKKTLHMHLIAFTTMKPELLQCLAGVPMWEKRILKIIDSIFKTEIPVAVHFKNAACYNIGNMTKPRYSRQVPPGDTWKSSGSDMTMFRVSYEQMAQEVVACTGVHGHVYPGACASKWKNPTGGRICRFGKKTALNDGTCFIQLEKDPDPENPNNVIIRDLDARAMNTFGYNRPLESMETTNRGLPAQDSHFTSTSISEWTSLNRKGNL
jgi:hypothetical protein